MVALIWSDASSGLLLFPLDMYIGADLPDMMTMTRTMELSRLLNGLKK
jgi:hypothetical protein